MHVETIAVTVRGCALILGAQPQQSLTFEHFHSHSERLVGLLLVDADGLGHHHLTEAALAQRFTQSEPETKARPSQSFDFFATNSIEGCFNETGLTAKCNKHGGRCHCDLDVLSAHRFSQHTHIRRLSFLKYVAWQLEKSHRPPCFFLSF